MTTTAVTLHLIATSTAVVLGAIIFSRTKGTSSHRVLGRIWVGLMALAAISSLWIPSFLHFSWVHLFILVVSVSIPTALFQIRRGRVRAHRSWMIGTFVGLIGAGIGALVGPDRLIGAALRTTLGWR